MAVLGTVIATASWILMLIVGFGIHPISWKATIGYGVIGVVFGKMVAYSRD